MKNKNFLLPVSRYAILDIRKGKAIEAALPTMFFTYILLCRYKPSTIGSSWRLFLFLKIYRGAKGINVM